jgi:multiple sugar transport system permease protein
MKAIRLPRISLWHIPLALFGLTMMAPLLFMLATALSPPGEAMRSTENLLEMVFPRHWHWENFVEVWRTVPFLRYYFNSLGIALVVTVGQVFTSACAAYAFARLDWPGRDKLFLAYLATMMVPGAVTMVPNFILMKSLPEWLGVILPFIDWDAMRYLGTGENAPMIGRLIGLDSYFALTIPMMFSAYGTFLLRQFLLSIPRELEEAAMIDGCGYWIIFSRIILPLALPGLATLTIFTFMGIWGSFLWPLVITNMDDLWTLPLGLQAFQGQYGTEWHLMMAAALLMILPVMTIFLLGQRFFISGLTVGGVKG